MSIELNKKQKEPHFDRWIKKIFWLNSTNLHKNFFIYKYKNI